jgi:hypothetical protein
MSNATCNARSVAAAGRSEYEAMGDSDAPHSGHLLHLMNGTSPGVPSWNQILSFLQQMKTLREIASSAA